MKVCVFGLWHLGSVTSACLAEAGFKTVGLDGDSALIADLSQGIPPLFEPGLEDLTKAGIHAELLSFTTDAATALEGADILWVTHDTPVDEDDRADIEFVKNQVRSTFTHLHDGMVVLISAQLPAGSVAELERDFAIVADGRNVTFACSPENLRLGKAITVFKNPERVIIGLRNQAGRQCLEELFTPFSSNIIWIGTEAAEMTKHALNAFLATCVTFINEIATICEKVGADASEVERALRSEPRVGANAYIRPGAAFAGGTLARDVTFLTELAQTHGLPLDMIGGIIHSNRFHANWTLRRLNDYLDGLQGRKIAVIGLSYKPGTSAIRRSTSIESCRSLLAAGVKVQAFDPQVKSLPEDLADIHLASSLEEALDQAEALLVMTEWPDFKHLKADDLVSRMSNPLVLDPNCFLGSLAKDSRIRFVTIGKPK